MTRNAPKKLINTTYFSDILSNPSDLESFDWEHNWTHSSYSLTTSKTATEYFQAKTLYFLRHIISLPPNYPDACKPNDAKPSRYEPYHLREDPKIG